MTAKHRPRLKHAFPRHAVLPAMALLLAMLLPVALHADGAGAAVATDARPLDARAESPARTAPALPRWEWGIGVAAAHLRDYPGSAHSGTYALPLPWFVWRSERVEVGRDGGRGILYRTPQFEFDFTLTANPPSDSADNPERAGMQPLDAVLEPGVRLRWRHTLDDRGRWRAGAHLPLRYALAIDSSLRTHGLGLHAEPGVSLDNTFTRAWSWGVSASVGYAEDGYNDYYYGVTPADATLARPVYAAAGGYTGWMLGSRLSWRQKNLSAGVFARLENVAGASFADSPLVNRNHGLTVGLSATWRLGQSRETVGGDAP